MTSLNINDIMSLKAYSSGTLNVYDRYITFGNGLTISGTPKNIIVNSTAVNNVRSSLSTGYTLIDPNAQIGTALIKKLIAGTNITMVSTDTSITINATGGGGGGGSLDALTDATNDVNKNASIGVKYTFSGTNNLIVNNLWAPNSFTGNLNVILGNTNDYGGFENGNANVFIGNYTGYGVINGNDNIIIGSNNGGTVGDGNNNIIIGAGADLFANNVSNAIAIGLNSVAHNSSVAIGYLAKTNSVESIAIGFKATTNTLNGFYTMGTNNGTNAIANIIQDNGSAGTSGRVLIYNSATGQIGPLPEGDSGQNLMTDGVGNIQWGPAYYFVFHRSNNGGTFGIPYSDIPVNYNTITPIDIWSHASGSTSTTDTVNSSSISQSGNSIVIGPGGYYEWSLSGVFSNFSTSNDIIMNYKIWFGLLDPDTHEVFIEGMIVSINHTEIPNIDGDPFYISGIFHANTNQTVITCIKQESQPGILNDIIDHMYFYNLTSNIRMIVPDPVSF